jgi:hypothetical protein
MIGYSEASKKMKKVGSRRSGGTASLAARTRKVCREMGIKLKLEPEGIKMQTEALEYKTKTAVGLGRFLTQKLIRPRKLANLLEHKVHGASYTTLKANEVSNAMITDIYSKRTDAFFRYMILARADCLPTPVNIGRWFPDRVPENCTRCGMEEVPTQAHILNRCIQNRPLMTKRHNQLAGVVRKAIEEHIVEDMRSAINENTNAQIEGLSEETRNLRPDMTLSRREGNREITEIIEFSCPYGYHTREGDKLELVFEQKHRKYAQLAREISEATHQRVRVTVVIVSSLGAIYLPSLKELHKVLKCGDTDLRRLGRKMSEAVIRGSMEIWREYAKGMKREERRDGQEGSDGANGHDGRERRERGPRQEEVEIIFEQELEGLGNEEFEERREGRGEEGEGEGEGEGEREREGEEWLRGAADIGLNEADDEDEGENEDDLRYGNAGIGIRNRGSGDEGGNQVDDDIIDTVVAMSELEDDE